MGTGQRSPGAAAGTAAAVVTSPTGPSPPSQPASPGTRQAELPWRPAQGPRLSTASDARGVTAGPLTPHQGSWEQSERAWAARGAWGRIGGRAVGRNGQGPSTDTPPAPSTGLAEGPVTQWATAHPSAPSPPRAPAPPTQAALGEVTVKRGARGGGLLKTPHYQSEPQSRKDPGLPLSTVTSDLWLPA